MATRSEVSSKNLLDAVVHLPKEEFDRFVRQARTLRKGDGEKVITSAKEADILHKINTSFPQEERARYNELYARFKKGPLSNPEQDELAFLIEKFELLNVNRLRLIGRLAKLRKESVEDVIDTFELSPV